MERITANLDSHAPFSISATKDGTKAVIRIIGHIGWETDSEQFRKEVDNLVASGIRDAHVYINTLGGDCFNANEIVNIISKFPGTITGEGGALVASAGTFIAIHCRTFKMPANGQFMIHKPQGNFSGNAQDVETQLKLIRNMETLYFDAYKAMATNPTDFEEKWNIGDNWMTATEAKEAGFVTEVEEKVVVDRKTAAMIAAAYSNPLPPVLPSNAPSSFKYDTSKSFSEMPADDLVWLRENNRKEYDRLYELEYGVSPYPAGQSHESDQQVIDDPAITEALISARLKSFGELSESQRKWLRGNCRVVYSRLFKEEYGYEPKIY